VSTFRLGNGAAGVLKPRHFIIGKTAFCGFGSVALHKLLQSIEQLRRGGDQPGIRFFTLCIFTASGFGAAIANERCFIVVACYLSVDQGVTSRNGI
jgi:hypothetical protein